MLRSVARIVAPLCAVILSLSFTALAEPAMQLQATAKVGASIVVAGMHDYEAPGIKVGKLLADGNMDTSFGSGGWATHLAPGLTNVTAVTIQPDGKVLAALKVDGTHWMLRLNADGSADATFGTPFDTPGFYNDVGNTLMRANALHVESSGSIVALGSYDNPGYPTGVHAALMRMTSQGLREEHARKKSRMVPDGAEWRNGEGGTPRARGAARAGKAADSTARLA